MPENHKKPGEQLPVESADQPAFNASVENPLTALAGEEGTTLTKAGPRTEPSKSAEPAAAADKARGAWGEAWREMRRSPKFWISAVLMVILIVMAAWPSLFTGADPKVCLIQNSNQGSSDAHIFGTNVQGCDVYARTIYGARASILVGVGTTLFIVIFGALVGALAGYFGGWIDALLARFTDIFFGIPTILGALVFMNAFKDDRGVWTVCAALGVFGWMQVTRIMRGAVITAKENDYVTAARALGAGTGRIITKHILPNSIAPVIVVATISLGTFIAAEATLSFLGIGLPPSIVSWGGDISSATTVIRDAPAQLFWPAAFLSVTVFSFILLGDVVRDALDPKLR
jgi:oligopeptide transport system permease protein